MLGVTNDELIVCGNSSLNIMYDTIAKCIIFGVDGVQKPWKDYEKIKALPAPVMTGILLFVKALELK